MAIIGLQKGSGKRSRVREKSGNFDTDIEWQPCYQRSQLHKGTNQESAGMLRSSAPLLFAKA